MSAQGSDDAKSNAGSDQPEPLEAPAMVKKDQLVKGLSRIQRTHGKQFHIFNDSAPL